MLKNAVVVELDLACLLEVKTSPIKAIIPPRFPSVSRDLALVLPKKVAYDEVRREILRSDALIKDVAVFDVYEGDKVGEGKKSLAVTITLCDVTHTLKDEEIVASLKKVVTALSIKFGAEIRQ